MVFGLFGSVQYRVRDPERNGFLLVLSGSVIMASCLLCCSSNGILAFSTFASYLSKALDGILLLTTIDWPSEC